MKYLKTIGILVFLSMSFVAMSQRRTINSMQRSVQALKQLQQMLPEDKIIEQQPLTDIDGNVYKTVKIGDQIWMAENLKVIHYRNGDSIANVTDSASWIVLTTGAWCDYANNYNNGLKLGKLYNFYAVSDPRGLAPKGWHVASDSEWSYLKINLKESEIEDNGVTWTSIDDYFNKMNLNLSAGVRTYENFYDYNNTMSRYWTTHEILSGNGALGWEFDYSQGRLITSSGKWSDNNKRDGYSVRCVKDKLVVKPSTTAKKTNKRHCPINCVNEKLQEIVLVVFFFSNPS